MAKKGHCPFSRTAESIYAFMHPFIGQSKYLITDYAIFFAGGRIDHGHHAGQAVRALQEAVAMNKAVSMASQMINRGNHRLTCFVFQCILSHFWMFVAIFSF